MTNIRWDYKYCEINLDDLDSNVENQFRRLGQESWELVQANISPYNKPNRFIFKRRFVDDDNAFKPNVSTIDKLDERQNLI
jgi:hypothetical protein